jgi:CheY-like chemotaxis protein
MMPNIDGLELVQRVRADPALRAVPIVLLTAKGESEDIVTGLELGADDYLPKPFKMAELLARVRSKVERPPVPSDLLTRDRQTSLLADHAFWEAASREMLRAQQTSRPGYVAVIAIDELSRVQDRLGPRALAELARQTAALVSVDAQPLDVVGRAANGAFLLLLPETEPRQLKRRLDLLSRRVVDYRFTAGGEHLRLTPTIGYAPFDGQHDVDEIRRRAFIAVEYAELHLDLQAVRYTTTMDVVVERARASRQRAALGARLRTPLQIVIVLLVGLLLPFLLYVAANRQGLDLAGPMYIIVVVALLMTAFFIWVEGFAALRPIRAPDVPGRPYGPASAIIAAYLPNEAATIVETVEAFRRIEYPAALQIILAYNTPQDHPVEDVLRAIASRGPAIPSIAHSAQYVESAERQCRAGGSSWGDCWCL